MSSTPSRRRLRGGLAALVAAALLPLAPGATPSASAADPNAALGSAMWLRQQLDGGRIAHNQSYSFDDWGLSADAVFAQVAAGAPTARTVAEANAVGAHSQDYVLGKTSVIKYYAGAAGKLLTMSAVVGLDPTSVGGLNLRQMAADSVKASGRVLDSSAASVNTNIAGQSWVMIGLARTGDLPASTVTYLANQQCADGSFKIELPLFDTPEGACATGSGEADATSFAIMALRAAQTKGNTAAAAPLQKAQAWLASAQAADGSWSGNGVDSTNSTGLAAAALVGSGHDAALTTAQAYVTARRISDGVDNGAIGKTTASGGVVTDINRDEFVRATTQGILALTPVGYDQMTLPALDAGAYVPTTATRILDTRASGAPLAGQVTHTLPVAGQAGLPSQVGAVVLNVTVTEPTAAGYVTAFPSGTARPTASSLNYVAGQTIPNLVVVKVGADGAVSLFNGSSGSAHLVADVVGYYTPGQVATAGMTGTMAPQRLLDTRQSAAIPAGGKTEATVQGVPGDAQTVILNVTVTEPQAAGFLSVGEPGFGPPTSNVNFRAGETRPNLVVARATSGKVQITNGSAGTAQVVVDIVGYVAGGVPARSGAYVQGDASRVLDSRTSNEPMTYGNRTQQVTSFTRPRGATYSAVVVNLTVDQPAAAGWMAIRRNGYAAAPSSSTVNYVAGVPSSNAAFAEVDELGQVQLTNSGPRAYPIIDRFGGYLP